MGDGLIPRPDPNWPFICEAFPGKRRVDLAAYYATLSESEKGKVVQSWNSLRSLIDLVRSSDESEKGKPDLPWTDQVLFQTLTRKPNWHATLKEREVQDEIGRAHRLLEIHEGRALDPLVVRLYPHPRQMLSDNFHEDLTDAVRLEQRFREFLSDKSRTRRGEPEPHEVVAGAMILSLIFDCGVLSRSELKAALALAHTPRPVRCTRGTFYLWMTIGGGENEGVAQTRRLYLAPATTALLLSLNPEHGPEPQLDVAYRALWKRMGLRKAGMPSLLSVCRGVAAQMSFTPGIPQFVVEFMRGEIETHAVTESTWRRLIGLAPWEADGNQAAKTAEATNRSTTVDAEAPAAEHGDKSLFAEIMRSMPQGIAMSEVINSLRVLDSRSDAGTPIERVLLEWTQFLCVQNSSKGEPRRLGTVRGMVNAIGPRLIATIGVAEPRELSVEQWRTIVEQIADEEISGSRRTTIFNSLAHLLRWAVSEGLLEDSPRDVPTTRPGSSVNATLLSIAEFLDVLKVLEDALRPETAADRMFQMILANFGYSGLRRGEVLGLLAHDVSEDNRMFLDVRHNDFRALKTDSSARRVPANLLSGEGTKESILDALGTPSVDGRLLPFDRISVDPETLLRRLSVLLSDVTGDQDVSIHSLRHSAATWVLLCVYAEALQLRRLVEKWPFLRPIVDIAPKVRRILLANKGSLHGLHAVRQLLGHRHESMSLAHYIHALDFMRYAAQTLRCPSPSLEECVGAVRLSRPAMTFSEDVESFIRKMTRRHPDRILIEDKERTRSLRVTVMAYAGRDSLQEWLDISASCTTDDPPPTPAVVDWHEKVVRVINDRQAVNRSKSKKIGGISHLDEIRPSSSSDRLHAGRMAMSLKAAAANDPCLGATAMQVLSAHAKRGLGWFRFDVRDCVNPLRLMEALGNSAGARVELAIERKKRKGRGRSRRMFDPVSSVDAARRWGSRKVFARLVADEQPGVTWSSHNTAVWCLCMAAAPSSSNIGSAQ